MKVLINSNQKQLRAILVNFLKKHYKKVIATKDYIVAKGDIPVGLVAHMDTVFEDSITKRGRELFYDENKEVMYSPYGAGFDDKAGVFAIIYLIKKGLRPHVIFTTDEEYGAIGAMRLAKRKCPFDDIRYLIQLDRHGKDDCVFYECDNPEFINYIENYGFEYNFGSFTDISELGPAWHVAAVNLSVGYYNEHTESEILRVNQLFGTIKKVHQMLLDAKEAPKFIYIPARYYFDKNWVNIPGLDNKIVKCIKCQKSFMEEELYPVVMKDKSTGFFCTDCLVGHVNWCHNCGNAYEIDKLSNKTCYFCREKENKENDS